MKLSPSDFILDPAISADRFRRLLETLFVRSTPRDAVHPAQ